MMCSLRTNSHSWHDSLVDIASYMPATTSAQRFHRGIYVLCFAVAVMAGNYLPETHHVGKFGCACHVCIRYVLCYPIYASSGLGLL